MLTDGLIYMGIGMTIVFLFLTIMVFAMVITAKILPVLAKIMPEKEPEADKLQKVVEKNDEIAVAIAAVRALG